MLIEETPEEIEFRQVSEIFFVPEMSVGSDTDLITTVDVVAAVSYSDIIKLIKLLARYFYSFKYFLSHFSFNINL